ncbi:hypothetical protein F5884DRAFT_802467 [Xylogone sp. PMI_703]|nr:hypothetical protein F5884DRAFT_802467 [Xylogone sp. PMI_703]
MADQNSYLKYKRDTRHLLYWMIHTSNSIVKSSPPTQDLDGITITVNTTGQIPASAVIPIAKLIAKHIQPIPSTIYRLFQSVIAARIAAHQIFQQIVARNPDPDIEKSNASHRRFIDILTDAFNALGGKAWLSEQKAGAKSDNENDEDVIFANKFASLGIDEDNDEDEPEEAVETPEDVTNVSSARPRRSTRTGKKRKGGKRGKRGKPKSKSQEASLEDVPLESYRIIEDDTGIITDYLMAIYSLIQQWTELRDYTQGIWHNVAYDNLNSAVAGSLCNIAIAMVKQAESAIFVEFPGHESYETVMKTITRGDPEKAQGMFQLAMYQVHPDTGVLRTVQQTDIDIKEQFLIYTYTDLVDFITDFQKTRSGKPTKPMLSEIRDWDPHFNLQQANKTQRVKWRRAYTINWLYDLVNLFSAIVIQRIKMKGQHWVLENVDWSITGPWNQHRRLFGLNEFAGVITSLAMQKPGTDIRKRISPHHVFELQCIVDSFAASRGWSIDNLRGHVLCPPALEFRPRRDVDLFLDRENQRQGHGYCHPVDVLIQFFEKDAMMHGDPRRNQEVSEILKIAQEDFVDWLGESKYMYGLTHIPPSRFSSTNANGLWEYSPFLCGVGLGEALEIAYSLNFFIWDRIPEPICLIHLHNMLVQKGFIGKEVGLYASFQEIFPTAFFVDGKAPTSDFIGAFAEICAKTGSRRATFERQAIRRSALRTGADIYALWNPKANRFFTQKSLLRLFAEADWIPERIPDEDIHLMSVLSMARLSQTKIITDPETGKRVLDSTELVKRARSAGMSDDTLIAMSHSIDALSTDPINQHHLDQILHSLPEGYTMGTPKSGRERIFTGSGLLDLIKLDFVKQLSGDLPVLAANYVWITVQFMMLFLRIEDELKRLRNPLWVRAYEEDPVLMSNKRSSLTALVLAEQDEECMEVMARLFQDPRVGFMTHLYWDVDDE